MQKRFAFRCSPHILAAAMAAFIPFSAFSAVENPSEDYNAILQSSMNDFKAHRFQPQRFDRYTVWNTDVSLSGQECQIWQWGGDNYSLVCSRVFPERKAGTEFFQSMQSQLQASIGSDITVTDRSPYLAERGMYTHIVTNNNNRKIDMFLTPGGGLFQNARTFHFVVSGAYGMPVRLLETALLSSD